MRRSSRRSPASASSIRGSSRPTRRTATGARPGSPPTAQARAPTGSSPAGYRPLEYLDMEIFEGHFLGWTDNPKPMRKIAFRPTKETSTRILALLNGSLDCTDTNLPADQVDADQQVQDRLRPEGRGHADLRHPHEQHQAAVRQRQRPQGLRPCLQLHGLHQRHPGRLRHARSLSHARQSLGHPQGRQGLRLRPEEGQGVRRQGGRRGRADEAAVRDCTCSRRTSRACRARSSSRATWRRSAST